MIAEETEGLYIVGADRQQRARGGNEVRTVVPVTINLDPQPMCGDVFGSELKASIKGFDDGFLDFCEFLLGLIVSASVQRVKKGGFILFLELDKFHAPELRDVIPDDRLRQCELVRLQQLELRQVVDIVHPVSG